MEIPPDEEATPLMSNRKTSREPSLLTISSPASLLLQKLNNSKDDDDGAEEYKEMDREGGDS